MDRKIYSDSDGQAPFYFGAAQPQRGRPKQPTSIKVWPVLKAIAVAAIVAAIVTNHL